MPPTLGLHPSTLRFRMQKLAIRRAASSAGAERSGAIANPRRLASRDDQPDTVPRLIAHRSDRQSCRRREPAARLRLCFRRCAPRSQLAGDFFHALAFGDEAEHVELTSGQRSAGIVRLRQQQHVARDEGRQIRQAASNSVDGFDQLVARSLPGT